MKAHLRFVRLGDWLIGYCLSAFVVLAGALGGRIFLKPDARRPNPTESLLESFVHWDATYYREIEDCDEHHGTRTVLAPLQRPDGILRRKSCIWEHQTHPRQLKLGSSTKS